MDYLFLFWIWYIFIVKIIFLTISFLSTIISNEPPLALLWRRCTLAPWTPHTIPTRAKDNWATLSARRSHPPPQLLSPGIMKNYKSWRNIMANIVFFCNGVFREKRRRNLSTQKIAFSVFCKIKKTILFNLSTYLCGHNWKNRNGYRECETNYNSESAVKRVRETPANAVSVHCGLEWVHNATIVIIIIITSITLLI